MDSQCADSIKRQLTELLCESMLIFAQRIIAVVHMNGNIHVIATETPIRVITFPLGKVGRLIQEITQGAVILEFIASLQLWRRVTFLPLMTHC
jgi:hypothetical protein